MVSTVKGFFDVSGGRKICPVKIVKSAHGAPRFLQPLSPDSTVGGFQSVKVQGVPAVQFTPVN